MSTLSPPDFRKEFFSGNATLVETRKSLYDTEIQDMTRGGHDPVKVYSAYKSALEYPGPAVILAHTVKGWGIDPFEGRNSSHQKKKMELDDLIDYRNALDLPIEDALLKKSPLLGLKEDSEELEYMLNRWKVLGGQLPSRSP